MLANKHILSFTVSLDWQLKKNQVLYEEFIKWDSHNEKVQRLVYIAWIQIHLSFFFFFVVCFLALSVWHEDTNSNDWKLYCLESDILYAKHLNCTLNIQTWFCRAYLLSLIWIKSLPGFLQWLWSPTFLPTKSQQWNATVCMNQHQNGNQIGDPKQILRLPFYNMTNLFLKPFSQNAGSSRFQSKMQVRSWDYISSWTSFAILQSFSRLPELFTATCFYSKVARGTVRFQCCHRQQCKNLSKA